MQELNPNNDNSPWARFTFFHGILVLKSAIYLLLKISIKNDLLSAETLIIVNGYDNNFFLSSLTKNFIKVWCLKYLFFPQL